MAERKKIMILGMYVSFVVAVVGLGAWAMYCVGRKPRGASMRPVETVSEERLSEMFKHAPGSPSWKATLAVLNQVTVEHMEECVDERLSNDQLRFRLGGVAALLEFNRELEEREREASRAPQKEEEN